MLLRWLLLIILSLGSCLADDTPQGQDASQAQTHAGEGAGASTAAQPQFASPVAAPATQPFASPSASNANPNQKTNNQQQNGKTSKDRLFFALPNFLTVEDAGQVQPLTAKEKFGLTARSSFDCFQYLWYAAVAGVSQAENSQPGYGQGAAGYGKRFGAHTADGTIENFTTEAILPSLLHQDPRYYQLGKGSFWRRSGYAMSRIWVTRTDSGHKQINYSEILGSGLASAISTYSYYPRTDRNAANSIRLWGTQIGYDTVVFVMREFWPDIRRKLLRSKTGPNP